MANGLSIIYHNNQNSHGYVRQLSHQLTSSKARNLSVSSGETKGAKPRYIGMQVNGSEMVSPSRVKIPSSPNKPSTPALH